MLAEKPCLPYFEINTNIYLICLEQGKGKRSVNNICIQNFQNL